MYIYIHIAFPHFRVYVCMVSDMFCIHSFAYMYLRFQTHSPNSPPSLALQMPRHVRLQCVKNVDLDRDIRLLCVHWSRLEMCVCVRVCVCVCVCTLCGRPGGIIAIGPPIPIAAPASISCRWSFVKFEVY